MNQLEKVQNTLKWVPAYAWHRLTRRIADTSPAHLIFCLADHFEPSIMPEKAGVHAERPVQERRLERWCREYPRVVQDWPDSDGRPFRHTYFYPAEQYDRDLIQRLSEHCKEGWGEVEIHFHHGTSTPDTAEHTRQILVSFREALAEEGCLSQMDNEDQVRYAFVHGNYALANSAGGNACGVDSEMQILAETGCYADLTLPSAPNRSQVAKINALYECALPLEHRAPHRRGKDLVSGRWPQTFPLIFQGPLLLNFRGKEGSWLSPRIENSALTSVNPPTMERLRLWKQAAITVRGRSDWIFIKLHCHGMDPRDEAAMIGEPMKKFLRDVSEASRDGEFKVHFVTAREMANIVLAACDGRDGNPGDYRDYRLQLISERSRRESPREFATERQSRRG
jgi:hypothetical protein